MYEVKKTQVHLYNKTPGPLECVIRRAKRAGENLEVRGVELLRESLINPAREARRGKIGVLLVKILRGSL